MRFHGEHLPLSGPVPVRDAAPRCKLLGTRDNDEPIVATFSVGHSARQHPDGLRIHDAGGHIATFFSGHTSHLGKDGSLTIRKPGAAYSAAATVDASSSLSERLKSLNLRHRAFWGRK
jgi:hypothetical protein